MTVPTLPRPRSTVRRQAGCWLLAAVLVAPVAWGAPRDEEPRWEHLTAAERQVLQPLQREWASIDPPRKLKWRELATQFPKLSPERQTLLRSRMSAWAGMSSAERAAARVRYQEAKRLPEAERRARWESYQSLPEDKRKELADRAQNRQQAVPSVGAGGRPTGAKPAAVGDVQPKSNIVPPSSTFAPNHAVAPGTVRANVGASTRPINERPTPPTHQQVGLPKIAATPGFVDSHTLLPQRGPQGAATVRTDFERTAP